MNPLQRPSLAVNLLLAGAMVGLFLILSFWQLSSQTIAGPDEPRYACPVRSMLRSGDWLIPEFNARPRLAKPIFFYWLLAASAYVGQGFGLTLTTAMRLGPVAMSGVTVLATFFLAKRMAGKRVALLSAGILMTSLQFNRIARELVVDMTLTAFVTCGWLFFHIAFERLRRDESALAPLIAFYLALALACLTKGLVLVALFLVIPIVALLIGSRQLSILWKCGLHWGIPLALGLGLSWYAAVFFRGQDSLSKFLSDNFVRMAGQGDHRHSTPFLFYALVLWEHFAPWSILIPPIVWWLWRSPNFCKTFGENKRFIACALGIPFLMLGLAVSKRGLYLLPLYPLITICFAVTFDRMFAIRNYLIVIASAAIVCVVCESTIRNRRESEKDRERFFSEVKTLTTGKTVVVLGESANEAVWYLDRKEPVARLLRSDLEARFLEAHNSLMLVAEKTLSKQPALVIATERVSSLRRGSRNYFLVRPRTTLGPVVAPGGVIQQ